MQQREKIVLCARTLKMAPAGSLFNTTVQIRPAEKHGTARYTVTLKPSRTNVPIALALMQPAGALKYMLSQVGRTQFMATVDPLCEEDSLAWTAMVYVVLEGYEISSDCTAEPSFDEARGVPAR